MAKRKTPARQKASGLPVMDAKLAHAAGWDAGNRSMRAAGRTAWNEDDWNAAAEAMERLHPAERQMADAKAARDAAAVA